MKWEDERYVRVYTRDTGDWLLLSFEAQGLWQLMLRKFDREGVIHLGRGGRRMLAAVLGHPTRGETIDRALDELLADGCCVLSEGGARVVAPNFRPAQDWVSTPAERMKKYRDRKRAVSDQIVTPSDAPLRAVTRSDASDAPVTPAVPCRASRAVPPVPPKPAVTPDATESVGGLRDQLDAVYRAKRNAEYRWTSDEENHLRKLLDQPWAEVVRRWGVALDTPFPRCRGMKDLADNWNVYATPPPTAASPPGSTHPLKRDPNRPTGVVKNEF